MNSALIALGAGMAGLGLGFGAAALRGDSSAPDIALARVQPVQVRPLLRAAALPRAAPPLSRTPAMPDAGPPDDGLADEGSPGLGEPVEAESYLDARDRAAAHSTRSR